MNDNCNSTVIQTHRRFILVAPMDMQVLNLSFVLPDLHSDIWLFIRFLKLFVFPVYVVGSSHERHIEKFRTLILWILLPTRRLASVILSVIQLIISKYLSQQITWKINPDRNTQTNAQIEQMKSTVEPANIQHFAPRHDKWWTWFLYPAWMTSCKTTMEKIPVKTIDFKLKVKYWKAEDAGEISPCRNVWERRFVPCVVIQEQHSHWKQIVFFYLCYFVVISCLTIYTLNINQLLSEKN